MRTRDTATPLMTRGIVLRLAAMVGAVALPVGRSFAQNAELPPEKARQFIELIDDPAFRAWLEGRSETVPPEQANSPADAITGWSDAVHGQIGSLLDAIPHLPAELAAAMKVAFHDVNAGQPGLVLAIMAVLLAIGFGAEWLVHRALRERPVPNSALERDGRAAFLAEAGGLAVFSLASVGAFLIFDWAPLLRHTLLILLSAVIAFRFIRIGSRLALSARRPVDSSNGETTPAVVVKFWGRRVDIVMGLLLVGWAAVAILRSLGVSAEVARLVALAFGLGLLGAAIEIVWRRPSGRKSVATSMAFTVVLVVLWILWLAGMPGLLWLGLFAMLLPAALRGASDLARALFGAARPADVKGIVFDIAITRGARALVIAAALGWLMFIWRSGGGILTRGDFGARLASGLLNAVLVALVADLLWQLSKGLIDYRLSDAAQPAAGSEAAARAGRLKTLLPIFRNVLAVFVVVVAALMILSELGVQIAPLIAGAGIFGVAIGFGSQTLVKDVLSGVFYMLDDAFRVGEYIQSGSYKGTVESFSLRSVRLRHHRGPIYTVPFGQLGAVQNMSRDWVVEKMTIGVTYDSDVELARKLIKKIGQELAADPEFAADTLEPLKMQGIDNFGDFAVELRMKLKAKPGAQFPIKRRAFMMIKKAFAENGIKIAVPTVHVEGGAGAAAAGHQLLSRMEADAAALQAAGA